MSFPRESYSLSCPADLAASRPTIASILAFLRLRGIDEATLGRWRLPLTEAVNNAILHGCKGEPDATVTLTAHLADGTVTIAVRDPGHYLPPVGAADLSDDLLVESGRGSFLIAQGTDEYRHHNDEAGHTLELRWRIAPAAGHSLVEAVRTERALDDLAAQLGDAYETITTFADLAGALARCRDFAALTQLARERIAAAIPHEHLLLRVLRDDTLTLAEPSGPWPVDVLRTGTSAEARVFTEGATLAYALGDALPASDPLRAAPGPLAIVPLGGPQSRRGTLALLRPAGAPAFTAGQLSLLQAVADVLGTAQVLHQLWAEQAGRVRLEQEMELAAQIQRSLLPQTQLNLPRWTVAGACRPSRAVGGDCYDWIVCPDGSALVMQADVMGKGLPAALIATMLRSSWRALASTHRDPGQLLAALNAQLCGDLASVEVFITMAVVALSADGRSLNWASAGHPRPFICRAGPTPLPGMEFAGPPLGVLASAIYPTARLESQPGDRVFLYTDGCYELGATPDAIAGEAELRRLLASASTTAADSMTVHESALADVMRRTGGDLRDDCTLLCLYHRP